VLEHKTGTNNQVVIAEIVRAEMPTAHGVADFGSALR